MKTLLKFALAISIITFHCTEAQQNTSKVSDFTETEEVVTSQGEQLLNVLLVKPLQASREPETMYGSLSEEEQEVVLRLLVKQLNTLTSGNSNLSPERARRIISMFRISKDVRPAGGLALILANEKTPASARSAILGYITRLKLKEHIDLVRKLVSHENIRIAHAAAVACAGLWDDPCIPLIRSRAAQAPEKKRILFELAIRDLKSRIRQIGIE